MSEAFYSAGEPGTPRCSEADNGSACSTNSERVTGWEKESYDVESLRLCITALDEHVCEAVADITALCAAASELLALNPGSIIQVRRLLGQISRHSQQLADIVDDEASKLNCSHSGDGLPEFEQHVWAEFHRLLNADKGAA